MEIVITLDCDGHFAAADVLDRKSVWKILTEIVQDGDYWENIKDDLDYHIDGSNFMSVSAELWLGFLESVQQRGDFEVIKL